MKNPIIAITAGDPNGVGYEILLKGLADPHILEICTPVVYGNAAVARKHAVTLDEELRKLQWNVINGASEAKEGVLNLVTCYPDELPLAIGQSTKEGGRAALMSLQAATRDLLAGKAEMLVTAPINKDNIRQEGFLFIGQTEYLTRHFATDNVSLMMMVSESMRVALATNHLPVKDIASQLTVDGILQKLRVLNLSLQNDFTLRRPRIAVLALNPHAGDNGLLGNEEQNIIRPAIEKAKEENLNVFGPYPADGFFGSGKYTHFDAVLAMYHDQGLTPFKTLDMSGVNYTAGLKIVRTSPDHGTAYDIAGKNEADPLSFRHALYLALDIYARRKQNIEIKANPLKIEPREERPPRKPFIDE